MTTYAGLYGPEALIDGTGHPITSATIDVFTHGTTTHVSLYQDNARVTPLSNPVPNGVDGSTAGRGLDTYGNLSFYVNPGVYDLRIVTGAGTRTVEIEVETDPAESAASGAGLPGTILTKTTTYTATAGDYIQADATSAGFTVTLPTDPANGALVAVKKIDASANVVTVTPAGGGTIDGQSTATIVARYAGAVLEHVGSNVWAVASAMSTVGPQGATGATGATGAPGSGGVSSLSSAGVIGQYYIGSCLTGSTYATDNPALNLLVLSCPILVQENITIDKLQVFVTTGGGAGSVLRMGIYTVSSSVPFDVTLSSAYATLLQDGGTVASITSSAAATLTLPTPQAIAAGTAICFGIVAQVGTVPTYYVENFAGPASPWGTAGAAQGINASLTVPTISGALPSTLTPTAFRVNKGTGVHYHRSA